LRRDAAEGHYVVASRLVTLLLVIAAGIVSWELASIREGWKFVLEVGAGTGGVYLLRWYWWRINAWSEISAMMVALACSVFFHFTNLFGGAEFIVFAKTTLVTVAITTVAWVAVTFLTKPEPDEALVKFYRKVRPHAAGWSRVALLAPEVPQTRDLGGNLFSWLLGCTMVYAALFATGELLFGRMMEGVALYALAAVSAAMLYRRIARMTEAPEQSSANGAVG
jgi:SSS family solute:Na+ symporter